MPRSRAITAAATLALAACQPTPGPTPGPDSCNAGQYQALIGTPVDNADFSGQDSLRIIPPNSAVTMDHRPDRLNVETDADGLILRLYCG